MKRTKLKKKNITIEERQIRIMEAHRQEVFFMTIWNKRIHRCGNCGKWLGNEPNLMFFDHLLEKSMFPEFKWEEMNIFLACPICHANKTNGFPGVKHQEAINKMKELL